jgi:hypothetical protein
MNHIHISEFGILLGILQTIKQGIKAAQHRVLRNRQRLKTKISRPGRPGDLFSFLYFNIASAFFSISTRSSKSQILLQLPRPQGK